MVLDGEQAPRNIHCTIQEIKAAEEQKPSGDSTPFIIFVRDNISKLKGSISVPFHVKNPSGTTLRDVKNAVGRYFNYAPELFELELFLGTKKLDLDAVVSSVLRSNLEIKAAVAVIPRDYVEVYFFENGSYHLMLFPHIENETGSHLEQRIFSFIRMYLRWPELRAPYFYFQEGGSVTLAHEIVPKGFIIGVSYYDLRNASIPWTRANALVLYQGGTESQNVRKSRMAQLGKKKKTVVFEKALPVRREIILDTIDPLVLEGRDPAKFRLDHHGCFIYLDDYGKIGKSIFGWDLGHVRDYCLGGQSVEGNILPENSRVNRGLNNRKVAA